MNIAVDIDDTLTDSFDYFMPFAAEFFKTDISVLVDDLAANCSAAKNAGVFPVLFVSRANKNERCDFCKAESWEDVVKIISKL